MIRMFADRELDTNQLQEMERAIETSSDLRRAIEVEQQLQTRVSKVMQDRVPAAPSHLRQRIEEMFATQTADAAAILAHIKPDPAMDAQQTPKRTNRFTRPNVFAVAASLLLVAGAVLFGIYGKPIDQWRQGNIAGAAPITEISEFVTNEHDRMAYEPKARDAKCQFKKCPEACESFTADFECGKKIPVLNLESAGYNFYGGGPCGVPHYQKSAHFIYTRDLPGKSVAMASVFVGYNRNVESDKNIEPGSWLKMPLNKGCTHAVYLSSDGSIDYLLVCCDAADMDALAAAIGEQLLASCDGKAGSAK